MTPYSALFIFLLSTAVTAKREKRQLLNSLLQGFGNSPISGLGAPPSPIEDALVNQCINWLMGNLFQGILGGGSQPHPDRGSLLLQALAPQNSGFFPPDFPSFALPDLGFSSDSILQQLSPERRQMLQNQPRFSELRDQPLPSQQKRALRNMQILRQIQHRAMVKRRLQTAPRTPNLLDLVKQTGPTENVRVDTGGQKFDRFLVHENKGREFLGLPVYNNWKSRGLYWGDGNIHVVNTVGDNVLGSGVKRKQRGFTIPLAWLNSKTNNGAKT